MPIDEWDVKQSQTFVMHKHIKDNPCSVMEETADFMYVR